MRSVLRFKCKGGWRKVVMEWNGKKNAVAVKFYEHFIGRVWWTRCIVVVKNRRDTLYRDTRGNEVYTRCGDGDRYYFPTAVSYIIRRGLKNAEVSSDDCLYDVRDLLWLAETNEWVLKRINQLIDEVG